VKNPQHPLQRTARRARIALLSAALAASPLAFGADNDVSQIPLAVKNTVAPNIMFTLDDSGSMYWEVIPDQPGILQFLYYLYPHSTNLYGSGTDTYLSFGASVGVDLADRNARFYRSAAGNPIYYNPAIRYRPWSKPDGTLWNNADPSSASMNPGKSSAPKVNLQADLSAKFVAVINAKDEYTIDPAATTFTFWPALYFVYTGSEPLTRTGPTNDAQNFSRIEIRSGNTYAGRSTYPARTDCEPASCSYEAELQNFANWFSYHRSRLLAARAAVGSAFSQQKTRLRVGYATINAASTTVDGTATSTVVRGLRLFENSARTEFFDLLYTRDVEASGTPLRAAVDDVGRYFMRKGAGSPWRRNLTDSQSTELSCVQSHHILMTDGYWDNSRAPTSTALSGNVDGADGDTMIHADGKRSYTYKAANPFSDEHSGTLADAAMHYWKTDLRTDLDNAVPIDNPDPAKARNPAFWQSLSTHTIGFGVTGTLSKDLIDSALDFTGTPKEITWPNPGTDAGARPEKLDDLAHAAVNGRGRFFNTSRPDTFSEQMRLMLADIAADKGASAASAVSNPNVAIDDNVTYETSYVPGEWSGDLKAYELDVETGEPLTGRPAWSVACDVQDANKDGEEICEQGASALLDKRTPASRKIATYDFSAAKGAPFQDTLPSGMLDQLKLPAGADNAAQVLAYLRGERSGEKTVPPTFRPRKHLLGAIVHSEPVLVRAPDRGYVDTGYASFRTNQSARSRMLYVGANDGMLHAFNAKTGAEEWAYVPYGAFPRLSALASTSTDYQATVDGYLTVADVDFSNAFTKGGTSSDWRTLLVGSLGRGGKGIHALDVTDPSAANETAVAAKVLWEFPNKDTPADVVKNIGFVFSRPIIIKHEQTTFSTDASGEEVATRSGEGWVVLVSSGYNNGDGGDGKGYLFMLDAKTGKLLKTLSTGVGSSSDPSGLGQLSAWADNDNISSTMRWVYGGDLKGNLWRFDPYTDAVTLLASLKDGSGNAQPISSAPELTRIKSAGVDYNLVAVGTGRYLGDSDIPDMAGSSSSAIQTQSMYVIADSIGSAGFTTITRANLTKRTLTSLSNGKRALDSPAALDWSKTKGWYVDLNIRGERVDTDPAIAQTTLVFATNVPNSDPCIPGGSSHLFTLDLVTGSYVVGENYVGESLGKALANRPVLIKLPNGKIVALIRKSDGSTESREVATTPSGGQMRRLSWRELNYR